MFDSIAVHQNAPFRTRIDLGELAETMLFYSRVHLLLNESTLTELVQRIGLDTLLAIAENRFAEIVLFRNGAATHTSTRGALQVHDFIVWERAKGPSQSRTRLDVVHESFLRATGKKRQSRKAAYRFLEAATVTSVNADVPDDRGISEFARLDIVDRDYLRRGVAALLEYLTGQLPDPGWRFDVTRTESGLLVNSNLDFGRLTRQLRAKHHTDSDLTLALLLDFFNQARLDLFQAARLQSELLTSSISSMLIRNRLTTAINLVATNRLSEVEMFQDMVLEGRRIADAVRSGHKSIDQVLRLVERARLFRSWLSDRPPEGELLREYYQAVTASSWAEKLPNKHLRFAVFTAVGVAVDIAIPTGLGTAVGAGLGAMDTYVVDRIGRGWKPNQFVDRELLPFVGRP